MQKSRPPHIKRNQTFMSSINRDILERPLWLLLMIHVIAFRISYIRSLQMASNLYTGFWFRSRLYCFMPKKPFGTWLFLGKSKLENGHPRGSASDVFEQVILTSEPVLPAINCCITAASIWFFLVPRSHLRDRPWKWRLLLPNWADLAIC